MAVSSLLLPDPNVSVPPPICFRNAATFSPASGTDRRPGLGSFPGVNSQLNLTSLATAAARQSEKIDLGALRAAYSVDCVFEFAATPTAGLVVVLYWNDSPDSDAGDGNLGGCSGADASYTGYSANLDASLKQLSFIGNFICTAQATPTKQIGSVPSILVPRQRYGSLVVYNNSGASFHSAVVSTHVVFTPLFWQNQ